MFCWRRDVLRKPRQLTSNIGKEHTNGQVTIFVKVPEGRMRSEHRLTV